MPIFTELQLFARQRAGAWLCPLACTALSGVDAQAFGVPLYLCSPTSSARVLEASPLSPTAFPPLTSDAELSKQGTENYRFVHLNSHDLSQMPME